MEVWPFEAEADEGRNRFATGALAESGYKDFTQQGIDEIKCSVMTTVLDRKFSIPDPNP